MKKRKLAGILGIALVFALSLIGCQQVADPLSSNAKAASIKVAGVDATLGAPGSTSFGTEIGTVYLNAAQMLDAAVTVSADEGSIVYYAAEKPSVDPYFGANNVFTFEGGDILWVEVFSANHDAFSLYAVQVLSSQPTLADITLAGRSATGGAQASGIPIPAFGTGVGIPGTTWNDTAIQEGTVWFGTSQAGTALALTVAKDIESTTWEAGVAAAGVEPAFATVSTITPVDGSFLYIKTANPAGDTAYYKIKLVQKNDDRSLTSVTINGTSLTIGTMGTASFPGNEAYGNYSNGAELDGGNAAGWVNGGSVYRPANLAALSSVTVAASSTAATTTVKYGHTEDERSYLIDFAASGSLGALKADEWVAIEVTSEIGEKGWYKFFVTTPALANVSVNGSNVVLGAMRIRQGTFGATTMGTPGEVVAVAPFSVNVTRATGFEGATVEYTTGGSGGPWTSTVPASITDGQTLLIRVTDTTNLAGNPYFENQQYWGVRIFTDAAPTISSMQIGATFNMTTYQWDPVKVITNVGTPHQTAASVVAGSVLLTPAQNAAPMPLLGTANKGTVKFAKTTGTEPAPGAYAETVAPDFVTVFAHSPTYTFANGDVIWAQVTFGPYSYYFKIAVEVRALNASDASISAVELGGSAYPPAPGIPVSNLGAPHTATGSALAGAVTLDATTAAGATGFGATSPTVNTTVTLGLNADSYRIAKTTGAAPASGDWQGPTYPYGPTYPMPPAFAPIATGDVLWVEVVAGTFTQYYKIVVTVTP